MALKAVFLGAPLAAGAVAGAILPPYPTGIAVGAYLTGGTFVTGGLIAIGHKKPAAYFKGTAKAASWTVRFFAHTKDRKTLSAAEKVAKAHLEEAKAELELAKLGQEYKKANEVDKQAIGTQIETTARTLIDARNKLTKDPKVKLSEEHLEKEQKTHLGNIRYETIQKELGAIREDATKGRSTKKNLAKEKPREASALRSSLQAQKPISVAAPRQQGPKEGLGIR